MTLDDIALLSKYAEKHPPLRALVQGVAYALGVKFSPAQQQKQKGYMTAEQLRALIQQTGGRVS